MGRNKKYQTEEERLEAKRKRESEYYQANKEKRSLYYKERYKKQKDKYNNTESVTPIVPKKTPVYNPPAVEEVEEEIYFEPIEDESASHYTTK
jgi:hypothetical protein